jgi:peptide/nickel transport system substrate-binding protein
MGSFTRKIASMAVIGLVAVACAGAADDARDEEPQEEADPAESEEAADENGGAEAATDVPTAVFSNIAETPTLDPAITFSSDGLLFARNVYEGLVQYEPYTNEITPSLATDWEILDDDVTYVFQLREGVTFHDGSTFDAAAAAAGLQRILDVNQGPATLASDIAAIEATGEYEVTITLDAPNFFFLGALPKLPIVSLEATEANATDADPLASEWFATNAAGTGPYVLDRWDRNQAIYLSAYEDYWQEWDDAAPREVVLRVDPDISTAMQLLQSGEITMLGAVGPDESAQAAAMDGVQVVEQPSFEVRMLNLNVNLEPLDDPQVREAISLAFDYQAMVDFFQGYGAVPHGPLPSSLEGQGELYPPMEQDMDRARELLAEAGYPDGGFEVEFLGLAGLSYQEFAGNVLEQQLGELGITVSQNLNPWPQMVEIQSNPETANDVSFLNQSVATPDPTYLLRSAYSSENHADRGGYNWAFYTNPALDEMLDEVRTIPDAEQRAVMVEEMVGMVRDDHVGVYVIEPALAQPVQEGWDVWYETLDFNYVIRFFHSRYNG